MRYRRLFDVLPKFEHELRSNLRARNSSKSSNVRRSKVIDSLVCN